MKIKIVNLPEVKCAGHDFLSRGLFMQELYLESLVNAGDYFLCANTCLIKLFLPKAKWIGRCSLSWNKTLEEVIFSEDITLNVSFLYRHPGLRRLPFYKDVDWY